MLLKFKKLHPAAQTPKYQSSGASGMDLHALEDGVVRHNYPTIFRTGLAFEVPIGFELQIRSKSGLAANRGLFVLNSPGTIDADYRGEVMVILANMQEYFKVIRAGDRIAQAVLCPIISATLQESEELSGTERGAGKFGSTGNA